MIWVRKEIAVERSSVLIRPGGRDRALRVAQRGDLDEPIGDKSRTSYLRSRPLKRQIRGRCASKAPLGVLSPQYTMQEAA